MCLAHMLGGYGGQAIRRTKRVALASVHQRKRVRLRIFLVNKRLLFLPHLAGLPATLEGYQERSELRSQHHTAVAARTLLAKPQQHQKAPNWQLSLSYAKQHQHLATSWITGVAG